MKKIFFILGLANILAMVLFVLYYIDALNAAIDNRYIVNFVDENIISRIPSFLLDTSLYKSILKFINDISQVNRVYVFFIGLFFLIVNIVTFVRVLKATVKDYFACVIRLAFSPITALMGFYITSKKNDKQAVMYENNDQNVRPNNNNKQVYNQASGINNYNTSANYQEPEAETFDYNGNEDERIIKQNKTNFSNKRHDDNVIDAEYTEINDKKTSKNYKTNYTSNTQSGSVRLVMPNKPIITTIIGTLIPIAILSGIVVVLFFIKKQIDKHASDLPGLSFFFIFMAIILGIIIFVGLPMGTRYFYKTKYLERCYRAIKKGTSFEDAKPIFKYFEKYTNISSDGASRIRVIIKVKAGRFKSSDHETKYFEYVNGILVDKDQGYQRTYMSQV